MRVLALILMAGAAAPVMAQDHSNHAGHAMPPPAPEPAPAPSRCEEEAARHRAMGHPVPQGQCAPATGHAVMSAPDQPVTEHSGMDRSTRPSRPVKPALPPAAAGSGPPDAADAIWGADAMNASREALRTDHGGMTVLWLQGDRAEYRARPGADGYLWDLQGYYGGDIDKLWVKSEGEGRFGEKPDNAEIQALWSHAIAPWWDVQAGIRQDVAGPGRTHAVIGVQGLAPYRFEVDAAAFLSAGGDLTARIEVELDQRVTQRLVLQPRVEVGLAAQDVPELGIGAGVEAVHLGLRLRYEIAREFAPYVGIEQEWKLGRTADLARLSGDDPSETHYVVGVRFWF